ncbi:MAG: DUF4234 domain-containing protein [Clostridia bacterium]|nr:DUF4234 domain-containing protein [Clostridia bacterium]
MAFCQKCGQQVQDGNGFCQNCGAPLAEQPPQQPYGQQPFGQSYSPSANIARTPVKTDYSLGLFILLSIVTFGIYGYYIVYKLAKDVNQMCAEDGDKIGGLVAYILLSLVTCGIYNIFWLYKIQNRMFAAAPRYRVMVLENGGTVLLWYILGLLLCFVCQYIGYNIVFKTANKLGMAYNAMYFR